MSVTQVVEKDQSPRRHKFLGPRVPPNLFGIALGIAGLAQAWHAAVPVLGTVQAVPGALDVLAAGLWLVLAGAYLAQGPRIVLADLRDPVLSPFVSSSVLTAILLAAALAQDAPAAGRVLVVVFLAVTIAIGGWLTGQWMTGGVDPDSVHPGYFLPTAAGGLIGANAAAQVHLHALAEASFGIGVICWVLLGSVILNRLFTRPALPSALVPAMAIELGIPAVAGLAYFAVAGRTVSFAACALGGYAVLMALVQVRLVPVYRRLSVTPGSWAFTFAYAAAAADALVWLAITKPPGAAGYAIAVITLLTAFASWIAFRTVVLAVRGQLFPAWPPADTCRLSAEVDELERAHQDSSTSSRPPFSDGPHKQEKRSTDRSLRERGKRRPGKRPGDPRGVTMCLADDPDESYDCPPAACRRCGASLAGEPVTASRRPQVTDTGPPPEPKVTQYVAQAKECPYCRTVTEGEHPAHARR